MLGLILLSAVAQAAELPVTPSDLCGVSDVVVVAEATSDESFWVSGPQGRIATRTWLSTHAVVRGEVGDTVEVVAPGGQVGEFRLWVEHAPELTLDRTWLLFLVRDGDALAPVPGTSAIPVRMHGAEPGIAVEEALQVCDGR